jgi:hypothetical protein
LILNGKHAYVFTYTELERLVKELYGKEIHILHDGRFIPYERLGHYTYHHWTVDGESELMQVGDDEIVQKWIETGEMDCLDMDDVPEYDWADTADVQLEHIMNRLFLEGHIPAGEYYMLVDW